MCSIFGCIGKDYCLDVIMTEFNKTKHRGPDMTQYYDFNNGYLAFHRLSIMGLNELGMQPFHYKKNSVVCNGEIYGFRKLKSELLSDGYRFISESDCELILPLYDKYGLEIFKKLDAEFALIIYDGEKDQLIAARDPIGIRPLFYGYHNEKIFFASEAKALVNLCEKVCPFPPGHYYAGGKFVCYNDISTPKELINDSIEVATKKIHDLLENAVVKRLDSDASLGFLLSGGLDSSLVCAIACRNIGKQIKTFAIGMETDPIDLKYAREVADYLHTEHHEIIMKKADVLNSLDEVIKTLESYDITTIRASIGMYIICRELKKISDIRVLLTGEISDEIFGYKYTDFAPNDVEFQKEAEKRLKELYMYDVLRADRCISANSMEARVPFGDIAFVQYVMGLNPKIKMNVYNKGKYLLRKAFEGDYLPYNILYREKAAFSDAVGHSMVDYLKEYAESKYSDSDFEILRHKYDYYKPPFTKESLLYREIFEKYYPGKAEWIVDYWMPNKTWQGCQVNDPSARVLSNYGNSSK